MAKHDQRWRDTRWQRKEWQKAADNRDRALKEKEWEKMLEELRKAGDLARSQEGAFSFLKDLGPGVDFSSILAETPCDFISQKYNGDGTYDVTFAVEVFRNGDAHESVGVMIATAYGVTYIEGRIEVHGRNPECNTH